MLMRKHTPDTASFKGYLLDVRAGTLFDRRASTEPSSILYLFPDLVVHLSDPALPGHEIIIAIDSEDDTFFELEVKTLRRVLETVALTGALKDDATVRELASAGCLDPLYAEMLELYRWLKPRADISMWDLG